MTDPLAETTSQELVLRPVQTVAPIVPDEWAMFSKIATVIANTEMVPAGLRGNPPAVAAAFLYGRAQGIDPIIALQELYVVDGKVGSSGNFIVGKIRMAGHRIGREVLRNEDGTFKGVRAYGERSDGETDEFTFTMEDADRITTKGGKKLSQKDNWLNYPEPMCTWRAFAQLGRMLFSDVFLGSSMYFYEELDAEVTGEGTLAPDARAAEPPTAAALDALRENGADDVVVEPPVGEKDETVAQLTESFQAVVKLYEEGGKAVDVRALIPDLDANQLRWVKDAEGKQNPPRKGIMNDVDAALMAVGETREGPVAEPPVAAAEDSTGEDAVTQVGEEGPRSPTPPDGVPVVQEPEVGASSPAPTLPVEPAQAATVDPPPPPAHLQVVPEPEPVEETAETAADDLPAVNLGGVELTEQQQKVDLLRRCLTVIHEMYPHRNEWTEAEVCKSASSTFNREIPAIEDMTVEELDRVLNIVPPRIQAQVLGVEPPA